MEKDTDLINIEQQQEQEKIENQEQNSESNNQDTEQNNNGMKILNDNINNLDINKNQNVGNNNNENNNENNNKNNNNNHLNNENNGNQDSDIQNNEIEKEDFSNKNIILDNKIKECHSKNLGKGEDTEQLQDLLLEEDKDDFDDLNLDSFKMVKQFSDPNIDFDLKDLNQLRNQYDKDYKKLYQQPNGHQILGDIEDQLNQLDILSDDFRSQISGDAQTVITQSTDELNATNISAKPRQYIPEAIKNKLDVLMLNFHKDLAVFSHQRVVLLWVAVRMYERQHRQFWKAMKDSYGSHIIMKRYCDYRRFMHDLENKYRFNPIILMISGYLGEPMIPDIYNKYRFKGIIVYTDKKGIPFNEKWVKRFPRIVLLTHEEKLAKSMLNKLIHNTLFRGACKFKDLDHFIGKQQTVASYFLKKSEDIEPYKKYKQKPEKQETEKIKQMYTDFFLDKPSNKIHRITVPFDEVEDDWSIDVKLRIEDENNKLNKNRKKQSKNQTEESKENEQHPCTDLFIAENFQEATKIKDKAYYLDLLQKYRKIVKEKNVLIRMDMLEDKSLEKIADLYEEIVKETDEGEFVKKILNLYTKNETDFYAIVNCSLNTLNEDLIIQLQDYIKTLRYCHQKYDDEDELFEEGKIVHLWRGCTFDKEHFSKFFRVGEHIVFPAFTSTSSDENQALEYGKAGTEKRIIFRIECVCDKKIMSLRPKNLKKISAYPSENEYLMNCFSLLYIEDIENDYKADANGGYLLYKLKMLQ